MVATRRIAVTFASRRIVSFSLLPPADGTRTAPELASWDGTAGHETRHRLLAAGRIVDGQRQIGQGLGFPSAAVGCEACGLLVSRFSIRGALRQPRTASISPVAGMVDIPFVSV